MCAKTTILLWLTAMAACCGGHTITIGDKEYTKTALVNDEAINHIVVNNGHVFYRNNDAALKVVKLDTLESIKVEGIQDDTVKDLAMDGSGVVWLATEEGLYKMESLYSKATYEYVTGKDKNLWCITVDSTNTVYVAGFVTEDVYVLRDNALHMVPEIKAKSITLANDGGVYYTRHASIKDVFKKKSLQATEVTQIPMPAPFTTWFVELNKKTDTLYILSWSNQLFYVPSGGTAALEVDGLNDTKAIGTDDQGNIYVGTSSDIYKLTPVPTKTMNVV